MGHFQVAPQTFFFRTPFRLRGVRRFRCDRIAHRSLVGSVVALCDEGWMRDRVFPGLEEVSTFQAETLSR